MEREFANKMFSPTAYFLGRFLSTLMVQILYPLIMIMVTFWAIGIDTSLDNFLYMMYYGFLSNFVFCGQGYFSSFLVPDETNVGLFNALF